MRPADGGVEGLLPGPGGRRDRDGGRDQEGVPPPCQAVPSRSQSQQRSGVRALQGDQRGARRAERSGQAQAVRPGATLWCVRGGGAGWRRRCAGLRSGRVRSLGSRLVRRVGGSVLEHLRAAWCGGWGTSGRRGRDRDHGHDPVPRRRPGWQSAGDVADGGSVPHLQRQRRGTGRHAVDLSGVPGARRDLVRAGRVRREPAVPGVPR